MRYLLSAALCLLLWEVHAQDRPELETDIIHEWHHLDYAWNNAHQKPNYIATGKYIPENLQLSGLASHSSYLYLTVPRAKSAAGVPWVLTRITNYQSRNHKLKPWPSYGGQTAGICNHLQNPLAIEMDQNNEDLYVVDTGRTGILSDNPDNSCPAKIVVIDAARHGPHDRNKTFILDSAVVNQNESILTSVVLDYTTHTHTDAKFAYISDAGTDRLIVYDFDNQDTWSYQHPSMSASDNENITINGEKLTIKYSFNSLAMSPDFNYLYWSSSGSRDIWQVPTWLLRDPGNDISSQVRKVGQKKSNSDGMYHGKDALYYSALEQDAIYRWESRVDMNEQNVLEGEVVMETQTPIAQNWETMQWPDTLALDDRRQLWFITNKAHLFYTGNLDFNGTAINFRVFRSRVDDYSYLETSMPPIG